jgi:hypothetical protein
VEHALTRTWRIMSAALTILAAVFAGIVAAAPPSTAATVDGPGIDLPAGPKLRAHGITVEHMGLLVLDGHPGICIDYGLHAPTGGAFVTTATRDPRIAYIAAKFAATTSNDQAAAANGAINWLVGNAEFRSDWLSTYVPRLGGPRGRVPAWASAMVAEAGRMAGPYTLAVRNTVNAPVGERSRYTVQLRSRAGVGVPAVGLSYAGSVNMRGLTLPARTDAAGNATVDVAVLAPGVATLHVAAANLQPWATVLMAAGQPGRQRLIAGSPRVTVRGSASQRTDFRTVAPVVRMDCTFQCAGRPPMELGGTVPAGGVHVRFTAVDSVTGTDVAAVQIAPGTSNKVGFVGRDGQVLRIFRQDYVGGQWTARRLVLTYEVKCPPGATIEVQLAIACDGALTGSVTDVNDTRYEHRMVVVLPGGARVPWTVAANSRGVSPALAWRGSITVLNTSWLDGVQVGGVETVATVGVTTPASSRVRVTRVHACGPR